MVVGLIVELFVTAFPSVGVWDVGAFVLFPAVCIGVVPIVVALVWVSGVVALVGLGEDVVEVMLLEGVAVSVVVVMGTAGREKHNLKNDLKLIFS